MFTTDSTIVDLKIKERNLHKAIFSMNFHQVATPELGVDEARCYMFFFRDGDKFSAYIVLYMPRTGRRLYYTYSSNPFPEADLPIVEDVARAFGEEMGFFLDEKSFISSSVEEKNLWIDEQPLFGFKSPEEITDASRTTETEALPAAEQPVAEDNSGAIAAPPVAQPAPLAMEYQPAPAAPSAPGPPPPADPIYPAPPATEVQQMPLTTKHQPAATVPPPIPPAAPAAPINYQPGPPAPAAAQTPPQLLYGQEVEIEPQVDRGEEVDVRPLPQKNNAVQRSSPVKVKAAGAAPRTVRSPRSNPLEEEHHAAQKASALKQQLKKETRGPGVVGREMEALARLMASF